MEKLLEILGRVLKINLKELTPATTYAISIMFKTIYFGHPKDIDVHTPPPPMKILKMPKLQVSSLTTIDWKPRNDSPADLPQYHLLIKFYLLLLVAPNADQQLPSLNNSSIEIGSLKPLLDLKIKRQYSMIKRTNANDAQAFQEPIRVTRLTPFNQYKLVWVQVSQYKEAYGLDHIVSEPFMYMPPTHPTCCSMEHQPFTTNKKNIYIRTNDASGRN